MAVVKFLTPEDGTDGLSRNVGKTLPPRGAQFSNLHKFGLRRNISFCNDVVLLRTTVSYLSPFFFAFLCTDQNSSVNFQTVADGTKLKGGPRASDPRAKYFDSSKILRTAFLSLIENINPYPTAFPYGNGMVLHFYQQQESSTTKTVHKVINRGLKAYV